MQLFVSLRNFYAILEYACVNGCPEEYKSDLDYPGQSYYGRGITFKYFKFCN